MSKDFRGAKIVAKIINPVLMVIAKFLLIKYRATGDR